MAIADHLKVDIERHSKKNEEKKKSHKAGRKVHHFEVTPASDGSGHSVETHFEEPMGKGGATMYDSPSRTHEMTIHKDGKSVGKHIDETCGVSGPE